MAMDRCLPEALLARSKWRGKSYVELRSGVCYCFCSQSVRLLGTDYNTIFGFFVLAASLEVLLWGDVAALSDVYAFSFLTLMLM